jgi:hypothetical protein
MLLRHGVHLELVRERLGHANVGITPDIYSHVSPHVQSDAAQKTDAGMRKAPAGRWHAVSCRVRRRPPPHPRHALCSRLGCPTRGQIVTMAPQEAAREEAPRPTAPFTLVVSDVHAFPEFLENALRRSGFRARLDHLVFAGDLLDRGGQPGACLERLDELRAEMLIGDHDHATMLGYFIGEQSPASRGYRQALLRRC